MECANSDIKGDQVLSIKKKGSVQSSIMERCYEEGILNWKHLIYWQSFFMRSCWKCA